VTQLAERIWSKLLGQHSSSSPLHVLVAFSGGLDSTVLLHAIAHGARAHCARLRAMHINHQLHERAPAWETHCAEAARELEIDFCSRFIRIVDRPQEGIEAAARRERYEAFRDVLEPDEVLVTAHHADDQFETVLLALLRGSGVDGLAAMPALQRFGLGWHARPMLDCTRDEIAQWATENSLRWIDDPSNVNSRFDRNYLRHEVLPRLRARWPSAAHSAVRTAAHLGEAAELLESVAAHDLAAASVAGCLKVSALESLTASRRRNLLRYWLHTHDVRAPSTRKLAALEHDMIAAESDRSPCVDWDDIEVRRHRGLLYCARRVPSVPIESEWSWRARPVDVGSGLLRAEIAHGRGLSRAKLADRLQVKPRIGGEMLRLPGHTHRRELKKLLQETNVLPWWRDRVPLIFSAETLVAVADMWVNADFAAAPEEEGVQIVWEGRPPLEAVLAD